MNGKKSLGIIHNYLEEVSCSGRITLVEQIFVLANKNRGLEGCPQHLVSIPGDGIDTLASS